MCRYVLPLLSVLLLTTRVYGQMEFDIDEVVVTATRTERLLDDVPVPTKVISAYELERAGVQSLTDALQNEVPGVVFTPDAMGNNMRIRGLTTRYVLVLVDGERLVAEGAGGNVNLDRVAVGDVERIEILSGAAAAMWGANAVGGVINIITKRSADMSASATAGSHGIWRLDAGAGGSKGAWAARGSVSRNSSEGFVGGLPYTDWGGSGYLGWTKRRAEIQATGRVFSHEAFNPENSAETSHKLTRSWAAGVAGGYEWDGNSLRLSVNSDNYYDYSVLERHGGRKRRDNRGGGLAVRMVDNFRVSERMEIVGGAEFNREEVFASTTLGPEPVTHATHDGALFAQTSWKPVAKAEIVAGVRYTRSSQFGNAFSPSLAAVWRTGRWRLRGSAATSFRPPTIKELHYDFDHQGMFMVYGNPELKAEKGFYTQFSAEYRYRTFDLSATLYFNRIDDKITQYEVEADRLELHYKNVNSATLKGVDMSLLWNIAPRWMVRGAYGFCDARDDATGRRLDSSPRHSATASLSWTGWLTAQAGGRAMSSYTYLTATGDTKRTEPQAVWRAAVSKEVGWGITVTAKVENIFGTRSISNPAGRQIFIGLKYKF